MEVAVGRMRGGKGAMGIEVGRLQSWHGGKVVASFSRSYLLRYVIRLQVRPCSWRRFRCSSLWHVNYKSFFDLLPSGIVCINQPSNGLVGRKCPFVPSFVGLLSRTNPKRDIRSIERSSQRIEVFPNDSISHIVDQVIRTDSHLSRGRGTSPHPDFPDCHVLRVVVDKGDSSLGEDLRGMEGSGETCGRMITLNN